MASRRNEALISMAPAFAVLAVTSSAIVLLRDTFPPGALAILAAVGGIPSVVMIQRGWVRVLWAQRIDRARARADANPSDAEARHELGVLYAMRGMEAEARAAFEEARRAHPHHAPSTVSLGHLAAEADDLAGALALFEEAATADPGLFAAHYGIASVWMRREQFARAASAFEHALAVDPDDGFALSGLARCLLEVGDRERAREVAARAEEQGVHDGDLAAALAGGDDEV